MTPWNRPPALKKRRGAFSSPTAPQTGAASTGLERLLDLLGHKVFLDFKQIRLGSRWKDEITSALDQTDVTLVYWTRSAAKSLWVRNEYEYFLAQYPRRPLVPIVGDETPLPEPLKDRQAMDLVPVVNEVLELKRCMQAEGRSNAEIQAAIRKHLEQAGVKLDESDQNKVFRFLGIAGWMAWLPAPLVLFKWVWRSLFEATAQLSPAQVVVMFAIAAAAAALTRQSGLRNTAGLMAQAEAREAGLTNQLRETRDAAGRLGTRARATEAGLTKQLQEERDASSRSRARAEAREVELTDQMNKIYRKASSHAMIEVAGIAKPMLLRFVDATTGRHRCTVQVPRQEDYSFWIPKGSYRIYVAYTDISGKSRELVGGDVERDLLEQNQLDSGRIYELSIRQQEKSRQAITPEKWGE